MPKRNDPTADELRARARAAEQEERAAEESVEAFGVVDLSAEWGPEYEQARLDARQAWVNAEIAFHELDAFLHPRRYARKGYQGARNFDRPGGMTTWFTRLRTRSTDIPERDGSILQPDMEAGQ